MVVGSLLAGHAARLPALCALGTVPEFCDRTKLHLLPSGNALNTLLFPSLGSLPTLLVFLGTSSKQTASGSEFYLSVRFLRQSTLNDTKCYYCEFHSRSFPDHFSTLDERNSAKCFLLLWFILIWKLKAAEI